MSDAGAERRSAAGDLAAGIVLFSLSAAFLFEFFAKFQTRSSHSLRDELGNWQDIP